MYSVVRGDDGIGYVACNSHCNKRIRVDRFHYHHKTFLSEQLHQQENAQELPNNLGTASPEIKAENRDSDVTNSSNITTTSGNTNNEEGNNCITNIKIK